VISVLVLVGLSHWTSTQELSPPVMNEMVETERRFAAMGASKGVRASFFEFFGEDGIFFNPHPTVFREFVRENPAPEPPPPMEFRLEWWPVAGDVADSGDLGYNTGPTLRTDLTPQNRASGHGYFFSVWKKEPDGNWRVAVDMGTDTPGPDPAHQDRLRYERVPTESWKRSPPDDVLDLESGFRDSLVRLGAREGYLGALNDGARLHRPGRFPLVGKKAIGDYLATQKLAVVAWEGISGGVAASGELGYTYGRYELEDGEKGYFTHVWKRDPAGEWKLAAEVTSPLP
jgi:ketosteroid isomerase-like protein